MQVRKIVHSVVVVGVCAVTIALSGCAAEPSGKVSGDDHKPWTQSSGADTSERTASGADFDKDQYSIDDPSSIWVVSDKARPLHPSNYEPTDLVLPEGIENDNGQPLRAEAAEALEDMVAAASDQGLNMKVVSAFRSFDYQTELYNSYVDRDGEIGADTYSARPGYSEHQTGLTADLDDSGACLLEQCFAETPAGQWLRDNSTDYGFILRYPEDMQAVTGFVSEPWHYRFVGKDLAREMQKEHVETLEEFFGLPAAPDYLS